MDFVGDFMSEIRHAALSRIEWDGFTDKVEIKKIQVNDTVLKGAESIEIWRNDDYKLQGKINGVYDGYNFKSIQNEDALPGATVKSIEIEGTDSIGVTSYKLSHCYITEIKSEVIPMDSKSSTKFVANFIFNNVEKKNMTDTKTESLVEWYLNGPKGNFIFSRLTKRLLKEDFNRIRFDDKDKLFPGLNREESTRDFAFIELENRSFIVQSVPKYLGPKWSNCIGIEFREEWGGIPDEDERDAISEITGFIMGKHLLNVGHTKYCGKGYPVEQVAKKPWGDNVISKCKKAALFPVDIDNYKKMDSLEKILTQIIPQYLLIREELNLRQALWNYWVSIELPIGVDLPILSAGIETIAKSWFKTKKSKTRGVYIEKKEFDKLLANDFKSIEEKLIDNMNQKKVLNKIRNSYNMGANERLDFFFSEIELPIGDVERKAIKERNSMAHGDIINDHEIEKSIKMTRAFQTLFHRIFLKILGFEGDYFDRSTLGWPLRNINEPMQGPID